MLSRFTLGVQEFWAPESWGVNVKQPTNACLNVINEVLT